MGGQNYLCVQVVPITAAQLVAERFGLAGNRAHPFIAGYSAASKHPLTPFVTFPFRYPLDVLDAEVRKWVNAKVAIPYQPGDRYSGDDQGD